MLQVRWRLEDEPAVDADPLWFRLSTFHWVPLPHFPTISTFPQPSTKERIKENFLRAGIARVRASESEWGWGIRDVGKGIPYDVPPKIEEKASFVATLRQFFTKAKRAFTMSRACP